MTAENPPKLKWTVLLYMAGDNNLSEECVYSLTMIREALPENSTKLAVLAQFDPAGVRAQTKRYRLRAGKTLNEDAAATGWKAQETYSGEPQNLLDFVRWGISTYPAEHYMVVLVGHGSGTDDDFVLHDDNPPGALSIHDLRYVFERLTDDGHTIDILGFDTCVMSMCEVCFELLRTNVIYMVGSEGFSPNTGWPYKEILEELSNRLEGKPTINEDVSQAQVLARQIVYEYRKFYEPYINGGISVDQSVLQVKKIDEVKKRMFVMVGDLLDEFKAGDLDYGTEKQNAMLLAHWETQSYNGEMFVDLYDFCNCLAERYKKLAKPSKVIESSKAVQDAISDLVVRTCVAGPAFQFSYGISIYFPWAVLGPSYGNLGFAKESRWIDFLKLYHTNTRRLAKGWNEHERLPFRITAPWNKGRDGHVESMRNPPVEDPRFACSDVTPPAAETSNSSDPKEATLRTTKVNKRRAG
jgi:hypothetical protein